MNINNKKIMIIGGSGALGIELLKKYQNDNTLLIFSRDEHKHYNISNQKWLNKKNVKFRIGDIKDSESIRNCVEDFRPEIIINAAAIKHVHLCEVNPYESVQTNIIGHKNLIQSVKFSSHKIESLIFISTDKACKPINVYGMCKSISERLYVEYAQEQTDIKVCIVRYGNVIESTGSVIPFFKKILDDGKFTLPITDIEMTRFLITLTEATDLIDWSYGNDTHGCISVPKIKSVSIKALAEALFRWKNISGKIEIIGIREGEKLHEEMISDIEWNRTIDKGQYYLITNRILNREFISYNSKDSLMDDSDVYGFLKKTNVI